MSTTSPASAAALADTLAERLRVSDEWNMRLQHQLQELLQLPRCDVELLRERMQNPDIAIPLLQCYDAAIQEKGDVIKQLEGEVAALQSALGDKERRETEWENDVQVTEGLLQKVRAQAQEELQSERERSQALEIELSRLRQEMRRALESSHEERRRADAAQQQVEALQSQLKKTSSDKTDLESELDLLQRKAKQCFSVGEEKELEGEAQRVRLQLLSRENEDKLEELERLRGKMMQALRQAGDNHAAHLRIVEERHRMAMEDLREVNRTHEMELIKLRAQLARVDPSNPASAHLRQLHSTTTTSLLESQTRQAQDNEIKRLYGELANAQRQRDDALDRYHQLSLALQEKERGMVEDHRREGATLQKRVHELRTLLDAKEAESALLQTQLQQLREKHKQLEAEAMETRLHRDACHRELEELRRRDAEQQASIQQLTDEKAQRHQREKERHAQLERRVEEVLEEFRDARAKSAVTCTGVEREREELRRQLLDSQKKLQILQQAVDRKDREREALEMRMEKLKESLATHKQQLLTCDAKMLELHRGREELQREQRMNLIAAEHLKMENMRLQQSLRQYA